MKSKKVHLRHHKFNIIGCSAGSVKPPIELDYRLFKEFYNLPKEQQCQSCVKTKYYQEQEQKMESERKASSEELGYEVLDYKYNIDWSLNKKCPHATSAKIGSFTCTECEYHISKDSKKQQVKCSFKAKNKLNKIVENATCEGVLSCSCIIAATKEEHIKYVNFCTSNLNHAASVFLKTTNIPKQYKREYFFVSKAEREEFQTMVMNEDAKEQKTQLEKDTIKYNLSDEHVEILSKVDYEVVKYVEYDFSSNCSVCAFRHDCLRWKESPCCNKDQRVVFKQIHKTQESLNESIKKEEVEKGIEEPYNIEEQAIFIESMNELASRKVEPKKHRFKETKQESKYHINYHSMSQDKNVVLDVYDLLDALDLPNAEIEHTFKKIVRCGKGDKSLLEDLIEAKNQLEMGINRIKNKIK